MPMDHQQALLDALLWLERARLRLLSWRNDPLNLRGLPRLGAWTSHLRTPRCEKSSVALLLLASVQLFQRNPGPERLQIVGGAEAHSFTCKCNQSGTLAFSMPDKRKFHCSE